MDCNKDIIEEVPLKAILIPEDEDLIHQNSSDEQSLQNKEVHVKKESHVNQIIDDESFEKAFNEIFTKNNLTPIEEEENEPNMSYKIDEISCIKPCQEEEKIIIKVEKEGKKFFPFTKGEGLTSTLEKMGLAANYKPNKVNLSLIYNKLSMCNSKFKIVGYYTDEKGKKKKQKKKRKFKPDDIRKKIKARFHKVIKNIINSKLKNAGSKKLFDFLPQSFITNITIKLNNEALNLTYENIIEENYISQNKIYKGNPDIEKYNKNMDVLNYLKKNPEICKNSEFDKIKEMKYIDILKAYFNSYEFEQSIIELNNKKEKIDYIEEYVNKALTYVDFFAHNKKRMNNYTKQSNNITHENNNKFKIYYSYGDDEENKESY